MDIAVVIIEDLSRGINDSRHLLWWTSLFNHQEVHALYQATGVKLIGIQTVSDERFGIVTFIRNTKSNKTPRLWEQMREC